MTPFEVAVLALLTLLSVASLATASSVRDLPRWYVVAVLATVSAAFASLTFAICEGVF